MAVWAIYFMAVGVFSSLVIYSVVKSVLTMTPKPRVDADRTLSVHECLGLADALFTELEGHRRALSDVKPVKLSAQDWVSFRQGWVQRLRDAQSTCAVESRSRTDLRELFERLDRLMDLYTTHAVQYAGEVGPFVDGFREAMDKARKDPAAGRF